MGFNSGILLLNDALFQLEDENVRTRWFENLRGAINANQIGDIPVGNHSNGSKLFHMKHADRSHLYLIGGNRTLELGGVHSYRHPDTQLDLLTEAADKLGYKLVEK